MLAEYFYKEVETAELEWDKRAVDTVQGFLKIAEQWVSAHLHNPQAAAEVKEWVSLKIPEKIDFWHLVETAHPKEAFPDLAMGPEEKHR